jgi:hypothetical protein
MLAGDVEGSWNVVEAAMASGMEPADVYVDVLTPAMHTIGQSWRDGDIGVDREHLASSVAASIVGRMGARFRRRGRDRGTVLVAMPAAIEEADRLVGVIVSVADSARLPAARESIAAARSHSSAVPIIAGGPAIPDEATARSLGADGWTDDARRLAGLVTGRTVA